MTSALTPALTEVVREDENQILPNTEVNDGKRNELRECMNEVLVDALDCNPSAPTLNNENLKERLKRALIS